MSEKSAAKSGETRLVDRITPDPNAPMPHQFFKYRSLTGDSKGYTRNLIVSQRLYFSSPQQLNDPFEFSPVLDFAASPIQRQRYLLRFFDHHRPDAPRNERRHWVAQVTGSEWQRAIEAAHRTTMDQIGVFAMTTNPTNILMWPHYADDHRGVCVRLELQHLFNAGCIPFPVEYSRARPIHNPVTDDLKSMLEKHALTKGIDWAYEEEWRSVTSGEARTTKQFHLPVVSGVILGARITPRDREEVLSWVEECGRPMDVFAARFHQRDYALELHQIR